jgi:hypothetical protein
MIDEDDFWSNWWIEDWQAKLKFSEKTCPSATLSTTKSHILGLLDGNLNYSGYVARNDKTVSK